MVNGSTPGPGPGLPRPTIHGYIVAMRRIAILVALAACSGPEKGVKQVTIEPVPDTVSRGTFAGPQIGRAHV